jgi:4-hydroxy-4-methyl-2-oxoglutarate aldolase
MTDARAVDALALGAATLGESGARRMHPRVKPAWPGARVAGPAFTVRCSPGDNLAIHVAVTRAPAGSVLVADMSGERDFGYWGEVLTTAAETRGIAGLVIDACVRDADALAAHGFPVFSTGLALTGASKTRPGAIDRPVHVGDVAVEPGDWIVADVDGVVVLPASELEAVLAAGHTRADKESALFDALRAGATTVEALGLDTTLVEGA